MSNDKPLEQKVEELEELTVKLANISNAYAKRIAELEQAVRLISKHISAVGGQNSGGKIVR